MMKSIPMPSKSEWLAHKAKLLGGSEVASLFGIGYRTPLQLFMEKAGLSEPEDLSDVVPVLAGQIFEDSIAQLAAIVRGVSIHKSELFYMDEERRTCATLDYLFTEQDGSTVPVELKFLGSKRDYIPLETEGEYLPPDKFVIQVQWQLHHMDATHGYLIAMIGNQELMINRIERDQALIDNLLTAAGNFWASVDSRKPPEPLLPRDYEAVMELMNRADPTKTMQAFSNLEIEALITDYKAASEAEKAAADAKKTAKAKLLAFMGEAISLETNVGKVTAKINKFGNRTMRVTAK
jgi:predicted phage-related endonuclease